MELHNRLRDFRLRNGLTQEALADAVGVTRQTVIAIEKRRHAPSVTLALRLARALDVPLESLFWVEDCIEGGA